MLTKLKQIKFTTFAAGGAFLFLVLQNFGIDIPQTDFNTALEVLAAVLVGFGIMSKPIK